MKGRSGKNGAEQPELCGDARTGRIRVQWRVLTLSRKPTPEGRARQAARAEHAVRYEVESAPVIAALRADGLAIKRLPQLHSGELDRYDAHLPVLIAWLEQVSFPAVVESLARALTIRSARGTTA